MKNILIEIRFELGDAQFLILHVSNRELRKLVDFVFEESKKGRKAATLFRVKAKEGVRIMRQLLHLFNYSGCPPRNMVSETWLLLSKAGELLIGREPPNQFYRSHYQTHKSQFTLAAISAPMTIGVVFLLFLILKQFEMLVLEPVF